MLKLLAALCVDIIVISISNENWTYTALALVNATITSVELFADKNRPYTLQKLVNMFILIFFVIANEIQYANNSVVSTLEIELTDNDYINFQIIVFFIVFLFNYLYSKFKPNRITLVEQKECKELFKVSTVKLFIIAFFAFALILYLYQDNMSHLFIRGIVGEEFSVVSDEDSGLTNNLIFSKFIRAIPFACCLLAFNYHLSKTMRFLLFTFMLIVLFPTGLSRNAIAMYWLPVALLSVKFLRQRNVFVLIMIFSLLVIFPFLGVFRRWEGELEYEYSLDFFDSLGFDASQEMMIVMKMNIVTWGNQLLGALLFFIPRSMWPSKPIGSGAFMASFQENTFGNISMPFWGEGFINFGYIGIFLFTVFLSWICSKLDYFYWANQNKKMSITPYYLILLGAIVFILRGDLLSSIAYTTGTILSFYVVSIITIRKRTIH